MGASGMGTNALLPVTGPQARPEGRGWHGRGTSAGFTLSLAICASMQDSAPGMRRSPRAGSGRTPSPAGISPFLPGGPISPFSPGIPVAPSRPSRPSLPGKPWPPCRPGVPGMPGCPEHSPGILLSSICKELVMSPRRKRRKSCFILFWRGWKGAEKDHSSGDCSEVRSAWQGVQGGTAGDIPPLLFWAAPLSKAPVLSAPATASPWPRGYPIILLPPGQLRTGVRRGCRAEAVAVALCVWLGAPRGGHCPIVPGYGGTGGGGLGLSAAELGACLGWGWCRWGCPAGRQLGAVSWPCPWQHLGCRWPRSTPGRLPGARLQHPRPCRAVLCRTTPLPGPPPCPGCPQPFPQQRNEG